MLLPQIPALRQNGACAQMKRLMQLVFLMIIACSAAVSVHYAMELYRTKYTPRYLKGN
jgi:hypothetical protein